MMPMPIIIPMSSGDGNLTVLELIFVIICALLFFVILELFY